MQKIIITVCTLKRPDMLMRCLTSLANQYKPEGWTFEICVVENDVEPLCKHPVEVWASSQSTPVHYIHEPTRGIPYARNAGLKAALTHQADWIAVLDDDEIAPPYWLASYIHAYQQTGGSIFTGYVSSSGTKKTPDWWVAPHYAPQADGTHMPDCGTCNAFFSAHLIRPTPEGEALRFDNTLIHGGEDTAFFRAAVKKGHKIRWVTGAILHEELSPSRMTLKRLLDRERKHGKFWVTSRCEEGSLWKLKITLKHVFNLLKYLAIFTVSLLVCLLDFKLGRMFCVLALRKVARSWEILQVLFHRKGCQFYQKIDGY